MKILLTGSSGQLGKSIIHLFKDQFNFLLPSRSEMDLSKEDSCRNYIKNNKPLYVINSGAFTNVPLSEDEKDEAYNVNSLAPKYICEELYSYNGRFLQLSTDYVFDGKNNTPIDVNKTPNPINFYGYTKYQGELNALKFGNSKILRTSWIYSPFGINFLLKVLQLHQRDLNKTQNIEMVCDQYGSPTSSFSLAKACMAIINKWENIDHYKLHWSDCGSATWYDFAIEITKKLLAKNLILGHKKIKPIYYEKFKSKLKRPNFSILDCMHTYKVLGITPEHWTFELDYVIDFLYSNNNS